jgi:ABC-type lipoprotein release transport system permease subunit
MRYIFKELGRNIWKTVIIISGYAIAAFFILILLCISGSNKKDSFGILQSTGTHFIIYIPTDTSCCSSGKVNGTIYAEGVKTMMLDNGLLRTIKNVQGVRDAAPCLLYKMYDEKFKSEISLGGLDTTSVATASNACARTNIIAGKFLPGNENEIVAEQSFAVAHGLSLGDTLNIFGGKRRLAGIVNSGIKPVKADFYAPIEFVRSILQDNLQCSATGFDMNIILVEVADARHQDEVIDHIKNMMYKFSVSTYNCYEPAYKVMGIIDKSTTALTIMILVFMIIFSARTQLAALMERFREVGILKSLGWSDFDLSTHILIVTFIQAIIGITIGLLAGIAVLNLLNNFGVRLFGLIEFRFQSARISLLYSMSLTGAFIASIFPVIRICRTRAGDIMKDHF